MKTNGFSLIELLVVIIIVSILSSYGFNTYNNSKVKAQTKSEQHYLLQIPLLIEEYFLQQLKYPDNLADILTAQSGQFYTPKKFYIISYSLNSDNSYSVSGALNTSTVSPELIECYQLTIKSSGELLASDTEDNDISAECWN